MTTKLFTDRGIKTKKIIFYKCFKPETHMLSYFIIKTSFFRRWVNMLTYNSLYFLNLIQHSYLSKICFYNLEARISFKQLIDVQK